MENEQEFKISNIGLTELLTIVKKRRKIILVCMVLVTVSVMILSLFMTKWYEAKVVIMPISKGGGGIGSLVGELGGLASLAGVNVGGVTTSPTQQFMALLDTRALAEEVIKKYDLMPVLFPGGKIEKISMELAVKRLKSHIQFKENKKMGIITITVEMRNPVLAATLANGYVEGLQKFITNNALTVAKRNRIFIEAQLIKNKQDLLENGKSLNNFYKAENVSSVEANIDVPLVLGTADSNMLQQKMEDLEQIKEKIAPGVVKNVPQRVYLQYQALQYKLLEQISALLKQQYEMAKITEAKEELSFQVIDPAQVPERKSRPARTEMAIKAFFGSILIGVFVALVQDRRQKKKEFSAKLY